METKPAVQTIPHYKVESVFPEPNEELKLKMFIERESTTNKYIFSPIYNISQRANNATLNGILIFMTKENDSGDEVGTAEWNHIETIYPHRLARPQQEPDSVPFDFDAESALIILFHDNSYSESDIEHFYSNLPFYYDRAHNNGNFWFERFDPIRPRVAGMTIIRK